MPLLNCLHCGEPVEPGGLPEEWVQGPMHLECVIRTAIGSAAHQLGECTCHGGTREDPPGLSRREAARLAYDTFLLLRDSSAK